MPATSAIFAGAGSGELRGPNSSASFAAQHSGSTASAASTANGGFGAYADFFAGSWSNYSLARACLPFDISPGNGGPPAGSTITGIDLFVKPANKFTSGFTDATSIVGTTQAAVGSLATSDYGLFGSTKFATDVAYATWTVGTYQQITLNSSGIAAATVGASGKLLLGTMLLCDFANTGYPAGVGNYCGVTFNFASAAGTGDDPYLIVNYTPPPAGGVARRRPSGLYVR